MLPQTCGAFVCYSTPTQLFVVCGMNNPDGLVVGLTSLRSGIVDWARNTSENEDGECVHIRDHRSPRQMNSRKRDLLPPDVCLVLLRPKREYRRRGWISMALVLQIDFPNSHGLDNSVSAKWIEFGDTHTLLRQARLYFSKCSWV